MKPSAVIGLATFVFVGLIAFIIFQFSSIDEGGVKVGVKRAAAACTGDSPKCLPHLEMLDRDGHQWTPESLAGKVVILNTWATWCKPCQSEVPDLAEINAKYKDKGVVLLGVLMDQPSDRQFAAFVASYGLNYPTIPIDDDIFVALGEPSALPTTYVYDQSGYLVLEQRGAISARKLEKVLGELL